MHEFFTTPHHPGLWPPQWLQEGQLPEFHRSGLAPQRLESARMVPDDCGGVGDATMCQNHGPVFLASNFHSFPLNSKTDFFHSRTSCWISFWSMIVCGGHQLGLLAWWLNSTEIYRLFCDKSCEAEEVGIDSSSLRLPFWRKVTDGASPAVVAPPAAQLLQHCHWEPDGRSKFTLACGEMTPCSLEKYPHIG